MRKRDGALSVGCLIGFLLGIDQFSKLWIQQNISLHGSLDIVPGFLQLSHYVNRGAVGGVGVDWPATLPILIVGSLLLAGGLILLYWQYARLTTPSWRVKLFAALAITPLLAHGSDRLRQGYVVDFIHFRGFPIFNFADLLPDLAIVLIAMELVFFFRQRRQRAIRASQSSKVGHQTGWLPASVSGSNTGAE